MNAVFEQELKNIIVHLGWVQHDHNIWKHERTNRYAHWITVVKYCLAQEVAIITGSSRMLRKLEYDIVIESEKYCERIGMTYVRLNDNTFHEE